jgi:HD-GYP domain-containing protein (c-di-GMP phosphodiesterase class II)
VLHHHERYDGGGYPEQLSGADIPLPGRIISVADAFDAMTIDRPYRRALPLRRALAELRREAGRQFDPKVVRAFLQVWRRGELGAQLKRMTKG